MEKTVVMHKPSQTTKLGLRLEDRKPDRVPKIVAVAPNSPAANCKELKKGDLVLSVNGQPVESHRVAAQMMSGAVGDVTLVILRPESVRNYFFKRTSRSFNSDKSTEEVMAKAVTATEAALAPMDSELPNRPSTNMAPPNLPAPPSIPAPPNINKPSNIPATSTIPEPPKIPAPQTKPEPPNMPASPSIPAPETTPKDPSDEYQDAAIKVQAITRGKLVCKASQHSAPELASSEHLPYSSDITNTGNTFESSAPEAAEKKGAEMKRQWAAGDTYEVTLERPSDSLKVCPRLPYPFPLRRDSHSASPLQIVDGQLVTSRASLGMTIVQTVDDGPAIISQLLEGQPAALSGVIQKGDEIVSVNGIVLTDRDSSRAVQSLSEASTVVIKGRRGRGDQESSASKLQAVVRGDHVPEQAPGSMPEKAPTASNQGGWCVVARAVVCAGGPGGEDVR
ncbi:MAG: hypothetical protein SGPRY_005228 [Prymnesium sp.]